MSVKKLEDSGINIFVKANLLFIAFCMSFVTVNDAVFNDIREKLFDIFLNGLAFGPSFFSLFDLSIIILCLYLLIRFQKILRNNNRTLNYIVILTVIVILLKLFNPHNHSTRPILGLPIFSKSNDYVFLLLFFTITYIPQNITINVIIRLFKYLFTFLIIRMIFLFILYGIGKGDVLPANRGNSVLNEMDTGMLISFFQTFCLYLFFSSKKKKYLYFTFFLTVFLIFTFKRTPVFLTFISDIFLFLVYFLTNTNLRKKIVIISFSIFMLGVSVPMLFSNSDSILASYISVFQSDNSSTNQSLPGDSGHFEQTSETFDNIVKLPFFGVGYGNEVSLQGAYLGHLIHNAYAFMVVAYGWYMLIFQMIVVLLVLVKYFQSLFKYASQYSLFIGTISGFFLAYSISIAFTTHNYYDTTKMFTFWGLIFSSIFLIDKKTLSRILEIF